MKKTILSVLFAAALVGCSKSDQPETPAGTEGLAVNFGVNVTATKAVINSDGSGKPSAAVTGIQILRGTDGATPNWAGVAAVTTTGTIAQNTNTLTPAAAQSMNADRSNAHFMAYYPAGTTPAADKVTFTITGKEDVIVAPPVAVTFTPPMSTCAFAFTHKLSQVELIVKAADATAIAQFGNLTSATINAATKLDLTISTGAVVANATPVLADLQFYNGDTAFTSTAMTTGGITVGSCMILPGTLNAVKMAFANRTTAQDYSLGTALTLVAGMKHTVTATVSATGVTFTAAITAWGAGAGGTIALN